MKKKKRYNLYDMNDRSKRFVKYYDQCRLPKWLIGLGMGLLVLGLLGSIIIAVFHDRYFSIFGVWDFALTHIWFMVFLALVFIGAFFTLGYPLLTALGAGLWALFSKDEPEEIAEQPVPERPMVKEEAPAVEEAAPVAKQPTSASIDEASLRRLLNTPFMRQKSNGSEKSNLDRFIDDVKTVRIQHQKGAKDGFSDRSITSIAKILYSNKYQKQRPLPSFAEWNTTLFECLNLEAPQKGNINKSKDLDEQITKLFGYLIPSE